MHSDFYPETGDLDAKHYRDHSQLQYAFAQEALKTIALRGDESILDVGCGDGKITAQLAGMVPQGRVIGVDKSEAMVAFAQESFPRDWYPNLKFERQNAVELDFTEPFDLIICFGCMHWIKDQRAVFEKMKTLLKPLGKVVVLTLQRKSSFWKAIDQVVMREKWWGYFKDPVPYQFLREKEYKELADLVGLDWVSCQTSVREIRFSGKRDLENYIRGWLPYLIHLPKRLHNVFLEEIGNKSLEFAPEDDEGCVTHTSDTLALTLSKTLEPECPEC